MTFLKENWFKIILILLALWFLYDGIDLNVALRGDLWHGGDIDSNYGDISIDGSTIYNR